MTVSEIHRSTLPARLDALPWSRWHWRVVIALGITWILDGLEVTIVGSVGPALQQRSTLGLTAGEVGWAGSAYVAGAVVGALLFGRLADRFGRKRLFIITLCVYLAATLLTSLTWNFAAFAVCRFLTGFGIGGEYAAINSAIDEMIPARVRGLVDLAINGSFWVGAAAGAALSIVLLDPALFAPNVGWRLAFVLGAVLAVAIVLVRRHVPESPRWLMTHGRVAEAQTIVERIETEVSRRHVLGATDHEPFAIRVRELVSWGEIARLIVTRYRRRAVLGFVLMASQAFFYNAIFFTYALVLTNFFGVAVGERRLLHLPVRDRQLLGAAAARRAVRPHRPAQDDRGDVCAVRPGLARDRVRVRSRLARRGEPSLVLVGDLLLRVRGRELGLSHGERGVPARDARRRDLVVLCDRHRRRRLRGSGPLWRADRHGQPRLSVLGLRRGGGADVRRVGRRGAARRRCGAAAARDRGAPAVGRVTRPAAACLRRRRGPAE